MTFSRDTLLMFDYLLGNLTLSAKDPDLVKTAEQVDKARKELAEAIKDLPIVMPLQAVADEA